MSGPISNVEDGKRTDSAIHEEIISAVNFTKTKAYADAILRLINMGLSEKDAEEVLSKKSRE